MSAAINADPPVPRVLMHVASHDMLDANIAYLDNERFSVMSQEEQARVEGACSLELHYLTRRFLDMGWSCSWCILSDVDLDTLTHHRVFDTSTASYSDISLDELNTGFDAALVRVIGSVEGKIEMVKTYFTAMRDRFRGVTLNNPDAVLYGLRKDYLLELERGGFHTIPTRYFERTVRFADLESEFGERLGEYLIVLPTEVVDTK